MIGPFQRVILAELTGDPITAAEIAARLGRRPIAVNVALAGLARNRCAEMMGRQPGSGAGMWRATERGFKTLSVPWSPPGPPAADEPGRPGECAECRYLLTASGHRTSCEVAA